MNVECMNCHRPLEPKPMPNIGGIRFCCTECVKEYQIMHPANVPNRKRWLA